MTLYTLPKGLAAIPIAILAFSLLATLVIAGVIVTFWRYWRAKRRRII